MHQRNLGFIRTPLLQLGRLQQQSRVQTVIQSVESEPELW